MPFEWDEHNLRKLQGHGVTRAEAEQAVRDPLHLLRPSPGHSTEWRAEFIGATDLGRILRIFVTRRGGNIRVANAYTARGKHLRAYLGRLAGPDEDE